MRLKIKNIHNHDDNISQIISWGHWFTLFNIFIVIILGSRYVLIADWPSTFMGRFYAIISSIGQFSFLCFAIYLIFLFPLSFVVRSNRYLRIIATLIATIGITLLLIDIEVFSRFRMHLNLTIWEIVTATDDNVLMREWQKLFIFVPVIFLVETLFSIWSWRKLRSLTKRRRYAKPLVIVLIVSFLSSHLIHIWADANFYRPITMQRSSLPLSYPMTARHFLAKYGFISPNDYSQREIEQGNPFAIAVEYPLGRLAYDKSKEPYNLLIITLDGIASASLTDQNMPFLTAFSQKNIQFNQHYSAANSAHLGLFSLFYGIDPNYYNSIMANHESSVLLNTIIKQQYSLGFFSSDGFSLPFYQYALLSNFSLPKPLPHANKVTTDNWLQWFTDLETQNSRAPWFSLINYQIADSTTKQVAQEVIPVKSYQNSIKKIDSELQRIVSHLSEKGVLNHTVIVITAAQGLEVTDKKVLLVNGKDDFNRNKLNVPFILAWPEHGSYVVDTPTTHVDIMRTLMENLLLVTTPPSKYTQGENLFTLPATRDWLIAGNETKLAALYNDKTVVIDAFGHYKIYDVDNRELPDEKLSLATFLQLVTANRRFMVAN